MSQKRPRRLRLFIALSVAIFGAAEAHALLISLFSTWNELPVVEAIILYGLVFVVAKWG